MTDILNNCRLDLEDRSMLEGLKALTFSSKAWKAFKRPKSVPIDWHRTEDQGPIGSCEGNSLTSVLERLMMVKGVKIQLSRIFAYLATQVIDGIRGDNGATITGGGKLAITKGCPPEQLTGYPSSYPSAQQIRNILSLENYQAGEPYKAKSIWSVSQDPDESFDFIGGGGGLLFGVAWYRTLIPADRIVRRFEPGNSKSGHAMAVLGYDENGLFNAVNSHRDGPYKITPEAWISMVRHHRTAAIGLAGDPEAEPINWLENSPYYK